MSIPIALTTQALPRLRSSLSWLLLGVGLLAMYLPTVAGLARTMWSQDSNRHGPMVLGIALWLLLRGFGPALAAATQRGDRPRLLGGGLLLLVGLGFYIVGRAQALLMLEVGSLLPVLAGIGLACIGPRFVRRLWFPLVFLLFVIPLPTALVDAITQPLKTGVSTLAEQLLWWAGYPVARQGVILSIGPFQLLVADACAGLNSLFTLEAVGVFYLNVVRHPSVLRNVGLAVLIVPVSFISNTLRVVTLALVTYHFGDAAGQGFVHYFAGILLFVIALLVLGLFDRLLRLAGTAVGR
ncbi:exosortase B [Derxia lacustris]|uniref:exosortase B n=1 Tax=Derxia lacustris TaxID=764842 RepID=UPI000A176DEF|nr:exosortase B [Derxia lacustris]